MGAGADFGFCRRRARLSERKRFCTSPRAAKNWSRIPTTITTLITRLSRARRSTRGPGFREADHLRLAKTFSGGWVMRAHIARLLVSEPAVTARRADEPSRSRALLWFQEYLTRYPGGSSSFRTTAHS